MTCFRVLHRMALVIHAYALEGDLQKALTFMSANSPECGYSVKEPNQSLCLGE